jgi:hypothetical protein
MTTERPNDNPHDSPNDAPRIWRTRQRVAMLLPKPRPRFSAVRFLAAASAFPAVGLGTAYVFDVNNEVTRRNADAVIKALTMNGGRRLAQFDSGELLQAASSSPALSLRGLSIKASIIIKGK